MLHRHQRKRKAVGAFPFPTLKWVFDGPIVNPMPAVNDTSFNMRWDDMSAINAHGLVDGKGGVKKFVISFATGAINGVLPVANSVTVNVGDRIRVASSRATAAIKNLTVSIPTVLL